MPDDELAEAKRYGRYDLVCTLADKAVDLAFLAVAALLLARPLDVWLQTYPVLGNWSLRLVVLLLIVTAAHATVSFPLSLYSGHIALCVLYLYALFKEKPRLTKFAAVTVVCWAIGVHSGTAAIFGFVPRELYQSPLLPASFVAAALASGAGFMIVLLHVLFKATNRRLDDGLLIWLGKLMRVFIIVVCYLILMENLHRFYLVESREAAEVFLFKGLHGVLFWAGMLTIGFAIPLVILYSRRGNELKWVVTAGVLVVFGVLCERYIIVIPGLIHPPDLFPGMRIIESDYQEWTANYSISGYEALQALGVLGAWGLMFLLGIKHMSLVPMEARVLTETREISIEEREKGVSPSVGRPTSSGG